MNAPEKFWKMARALMGMLILLIIVIAIKELKSIGYVGVDTQTTDTITVNGTGDAVSPPDVATFSFTVMETATTVADAQSAATAKINAALKTVRDAGVADKDIQTESYSISPHYEYQSAICPANGTYCPQGKQVLTGYDVSQSIQIKVRDLTKAGSIFTSIGSLGVQNVGGLTFSVDNPDSVQAQARAAAITDAKTKAQALAKQLGVSLVRVTDFSESNYQPNPIVFGMAAANGMTSAPAPAAPQIPAGEQKVTDNVTITYEIR